MMMMQEAQKLIIRKGDNHHHPMSCDTSSGGYFVCENVRSLLSGNQRTGLVMIVRCGWNYAPLQTLNVLSTDFVIQHVSHLV